MNNEVIRNLNTFLKGHLVAIQAYENYIDHIQDKDIKKALKNILRSHKNHAAIVTERINNLGGIPTDEIGMMGHLAKVIGSIKNPSKNNISILKDALAGEYRGIKKSKELLDGGLDSESLKLVQSILDEDESHVELLNEFIH